MNKVILIGNLGRDPELKNTSGGQSVCDFSIATTDTWTDKNGQKQERTEWHRIVVWGRQGENCHKYLKKGRSALVEGRLQTREWNDKDGNKRYTTEIVADRVQFLGDGRGAERGESAPPPAQSARSGATSEPPRQMDAPGDFVDDEIPF